MLGLKLNHVSKRGHWCQFVKFSIVAYSVTRYCLADLQYRSCNRLVTVGTVFILKSCYHRNPHQKLYQKARFFVRISPWIWPLMRFCLISWYNSNEMCTYHFWLLCVYLHQFVVLTNIYWKRDSKLPDNVIFSVCILHNNYAQKQTGIKYTEQNW